MANTNKRSGPQLACEIMPERIIAARATDNGTALDSFTAKNMAAGTVIPRLGEENIVSTETLRQAIGDALTTVGARSRELVAILPDAAVRVTLLDFDTLPDKRSDADEVIRFRLRKALPLDVEKCALSYDVLRSDGKVRVVAAVALASVIAEYESIFRDLGYTPGVVLPSTLAALGNVSGNDPILVIKSDANTTTMAIVAAGELLLYRTLENNTGGVAPSGEQLVEDIHASLIFFQDTYNMRVTRILVGGLIDADQVRETIESQTDTRVENLVTSTEIGAARPNFPASNLAGVVGALLG